MTSYFRLLYDSVRRQIISGEIRKWVIMGIFIGIIAGLGSIAIYYSIELGTKYILTEITGFAPPRTYISGGQTVYALPPYFTLPTMKFLLIPVSTTLGGLVSGFIVYRYAPEAEGHGTDAAIDAFHNKDGKIRRRIPLVKLAASAVTIGSGGSAGREGPTAQIAAGFGSAVADFFRMNDKDRRIAMATGIGAGIGSVFMAPLGGALLSSEILYKRDFEVDALIPSIIASVVGYSIFGYLFDYKPIFSIPAGDITGFYHPASLLLYLVLGIASGLVGMGYVRMFYGVQTLFSKLDPISKYFRPAIGGFAVGIIAMFFPEVMGLGYGWIQQEFYYALYFPLILLVVLVLAKMLATSLTIGSGGSGGVFAPGLVIGAFLGGVLAILFQPFFPFLSNQDIIVVTMIAFFGGISNAPLSVIIMGTEMTQSYALFIPLMLATVTAYFVKGSNGIYRKQVRNRAESKAHAYEYEKPIMDEVKVYEAMKKDYLFVTPETPLKDAVLKIRESRTKGIVVEKDRKFVGYLSLENLNEELVQRNPSVSEVMSQVQDMTIGINDNIHLGLDMLTKSSVGKLVVLDDDDNVVGTLGFSEIADAYNREIRHIKAMAMSRS